ncbi:hypothetical protein ACLKMY_00545 [Paraburkholderia mimosarum]|uniref:hypothetical protein n=1 Tax=Paraburkholderia mimosarum TaxID=312026 RepID=UPI0039C34316
MVDQLHRLPGRTHRACVQRAIRIGVSAIQASMWSEAEDDIIRKGYHNGTPIKKLLAQLPGRTYRGVGARALRLGLNGKFNGKTGSQYSWIEDAARRLLDEGTPMSCRDIADAIGASAEGTVHMLRRVHGKSFYIADWRKTSNGHEALWLVGRRADAPKPPPASNAEKCRRSRARRRIRTGGFNPFATLAQQVAQ